MWVSDVINDVIRATPLGQRRIRFSVTTMHLSWPHDLTQICEVGRSVSHPHTYSFTDLLTYVLCVCVRACVCAWCDVQVTDDNDHSPTFEADIYESSIEENNDEGAVLFRVTASDLDTQPVTLTLATTPKSTTRLTRKWLASSRSTARLDWCELPCRWTANSFLNSTSTSLPPTEVNLQGHHHLQGHPRNLQGHRGLGFTW